MAKGILEKHREINRAVLITSLQTHLRQSRTDEQNQVDLDASQTVELEATPEGLESDMGVSGNSEQVESGEPAEETSEAEREHQADLEAEEVDSETKKKGSGNVYSIAAPALLGFDLMANGHPTAFGLLAGVLSLLPLSAPVASGVFGWLGRKTTSEDSNVEPHHPYRDQDYGGAGTLPASGFQGTVLSRYSGGEPRMVQLAKNQVLDGVRVNKEWPVEFHENGRLASAVLAWPLFLPGWKINRGSEMHFDEAGQVRSIRMVGEQKIGSIRIPSGSVVSFDADGYIVGIDHPQFNFSKAKEQVKAWRGILEKSTHEYFLLRRPLSKSYVSAAFNLAMWGDPWAIPALLEILEKSTNNVWRAKAIMRLGKLRAKEALPKLLAIAQNPRETSQVRSHALRSAEILLNEGGRRKNFMMPLELLFRDTFHRMMWGSAGGALLHPLAAGGNPLHEGVLILGAMAVFALLGRAVSGRLYRNRVARAEWAAWDQAAPPSKIRVGEFQDSQPEEVSPVESNAEQTSAQNVEGEREAQAESEAESDESEKGRKEKNQ